jgi:probable phosphoglycerate mutase
MSTRQEPTELVLVRHGQAEINVTREPYDAVCRGLTAQGREQARLVADRLEADASRRPGFAALYYSTLQRAAQTARIIAEVLGMDPIAHDGLRNPDHGNPAMDYWNPHLNTLGTIAPLAPHRAPGPGAETWAAYLARTDEVLHALMARHLGERILVVAHAETADAALHAFARLPLTASAYVYPHTDNTAITIWRHHFLGLPGEDPGGQFVLYKANDTSHLEGAR